MPLTSEVEASVGRFVRETLFWQCGGVVTDLDGTVVHEVEGRTSMPPEVELALRELSSSGRPVVLNTLRFPLSVLRTFGREWYAISDAPIPAVTLNGSLTGHVVKRPDGELAFEELDAFPLEPDQIETVLRGVAQMVDAGLDDLLVFYYPRDWRMGEIIWTAVPERVLAVKEKYVSASSVTAVELAKLQDQMLAEDVCMTFLIVDAPEDRLMAYQHTKRANFFTREGVDKRSGALAIAERLGIDLGHSVGAGDTPMDTFLASVGLSVHVGGIPLDFEGDVATVRLRDSLELGELLFRLADLHKVSRG
jgi:hydroxymethylpyrimidine pyrophosphatase-like HAD family hydrolase